MDNTPDGNRTRAACCTPNLKFGMEGKHDNHFTTSVVEHVEETCYTHRVKHLDCQTSAPRVRNYVRDLPLFVFV